MRRGQVHGVLRGVCIAGALLYSAMAQAEGVAGPRIDIPVPDIRASIMARLKNAPHLPVDRQAAPPGNRSTSASAPAGQAAGVRAPAPPTPPQAPEASAAQLEGDSSPDWSLDLSQPPVERAEREDGHTPMPDTSVTVRTLDDLDRLETKYFKPKKSASSE
mgnify:CR=1 FL=1